MMSLKQSISYQIFMLLLTCLHAGESRLNDTCKNGGQLTVMYWHHCPYIMHTSRDQVSGIFPNILSSIVKQCCHSNITLVYQKTKGPADFHNAIKEVRLNSTPFGYNHCMLVQKVLPRHSMHDYGKDGGCIPFPSDALRSKIFKSQPRFDIALPLHTTTYGKASFETLPFVAIAESIGIAVLKHGNVPSGKLMSSIIQAWPVLLFIVLAACIAGIIIWFVERRSNSKQFSASFSRGAFDGFWWAFVSMTSVGYGDKYPKSILGKLLGSCWIVTGMLFVTMFLGTLTSTLMTLLMQGTFDIQHEKITVINNSIAHWMGIEHHASVKAMKKQEDLYDPLIDYEVDAALADINSLKDVVHNLQKEYNIRVSGILLKETFYGIVLREKADNLTECFHEYIEKNEHLIFRKMSEYSGTQKDKLNPAEDYFGSGGIFSKSVYCMIGVFASFCVAGFIWEVNKQRNLNSMKEASNVEYNSEELFQNGRLPLGTLSTSTDAFPSDCPYHLKDPFDMVEQCHSRQSDV